MAESIWIYRLPIKTNDTVQRVQSHTINALEWEQTKRRTHPAPVPQTNK